MEENLRTTIITLFPEVFSYLDTSVIKRAQEKNILKIEYVNPRDFTKDKHRSVDDYPYGGGSGMVIKPEPIFEAFEHTRNVLKNNGKIIITTPQGNILNQALATELAQEKELVIICGHYEGFDERIYSLADMEISIGDYVLTGGELPAMVLVDSMARMVPGVIAQDSAICDSFQNSMLDYPHYTRPQTYKDMEVPPVLLSGNHKKIAQWRRKEAILRTLVRRPELLGESPLSHEDFVVLEEIFREKIKDCMK